MIFETLRLKETKVMIERTSIFLPVPDIDFLKEERNEEEILKETARSRIRNKIISLIIIFLINVVEILDLPTELNFVQKSIWLVDLSFRIK